MDGLTNKPGEGCLYRVRNEKLTLTYLNLRTVRNLWNKHTYFRTNHGRLLKPITSLFLVFGYFCFVRRFSILQFGP